MDSLIVTYCAVGLRSGNEIDTLLSQHCNFFMSLNRMPGKEHAKERLQKRTRSFWRILPLGKQWT